jgi:hypothetical protein
MCFWHCCSLEFSVSVVPVATMVGGMTDGHEKAVFDDCECPKLPQPRAAQRAIMMHDHH